jgi:hypothetical protein
MLLGQNRVVLALQPLLRPNWFSKASSPFCKSGLNVIGSSLDKLVSPHVGWRILVFFVKLIERLVIDLLKLQRAKTTASLLKVCAILSIAVDISHLSHLSLSSENRGNLTSECHRIRVQTLPNTQLLGVV